MCHLEKYSISYQRRRLPLVHILQCGKLGSCRCYVSAVENVMETFSSPSPPTSGLHTSATKTLGPKLSFSNLVKRIFAIMLSEHDQASALGCDPFVPNNLSTSYFPLPWRWFISHTMRLHVTCVSKKPKGNERDRIQIQVVECKYSLAIYPQSEVWTSGPI
jgi:hypothetical protein